MSGFAHLWHWIEVHTGTVNEPGPYYGFFSGFGSDIGEIALLGAVVGGWRHVNCHQRHCLRFGRHPTIDGYKLCHKHIGQPLGALTLPPVHEDHQ